MNGTPSLIINGISLSGAPSADVWTSLPYDPTSGALDLGESAALTRLDLTKGRRVRLVHGNAPLMYTPLSISHIIRAAPCFLNPILLSTHYIP